MTSFNKKAYIIGFVVMMAMVFSSAASAASWTGPTATPPGNNVDAPVNVSSNAQVKLVTGTSSTTDGGLSVGAFVAYLASQFYGKVTVGDPNQTLHSFENIQGYGGINLTDTTKGIDYSTPTGASNGSVVNANLQGNIRAVGGDFSDRVHIGPYNSPGEALNIDVTDPVIYSQATNGSATTGTNANQLNELQPNQESPSLIQKWIALFSPQTADAAQDTAGTNTLQYCTDPLASNYGGIAPCVYGGPAGPTTTGTTSVLQGPGNGTLQYQVNHQFNPKFIVDVDSQFDAANNTEVRLPTLTYVDNGSGTPTAVCLSDGTNCQTSTTTTTPGLTGTPGNLPMYNNTTGVGFESSPIGYNYNNTFLNVGTSLNITGSTTVTGNSNVEGDANIVGNANVTGNVTTPAVIVDTATEVIGVNYAGEGDTCSQGSSQHMIRACKVRVAGFNGPNDYIHTLCVCAYNALDNTGPGTRWLPLTSNQNY